MKTPYLQAFYEDEHIIVCCKPPQIATECGKIRCPDMVSIIKKHICQTPKSSGEPYLGIIHRLDQPVSGILVFAKTPYAAAELSKQLQNRGFGKYYRALVTEPPKEKEGTLENYLLKDARANISRICAEDTPGAKFARLHYKIVEKGQGIFSWGRGKINFTPSPTELEIHLDTGRHHQIRVQLAGLGCPIIGDAKYNPHTSRQKGWQNICLCAYKLSFKHPKTQKLMHFEISPEEMNSIYFGTGQNQSGTGYF